MVFDIFLQGMALIETVLSKKMTEPQLKAYYTLLHDVPNELFENGVMKLMQERVYTNIPSPAEIRTYCLESRGTDLLVRAAEAKQKLKQAIYSVGTYETVVFDDPILHLMIRDLGGWCKTGSMPDKEFEDYLKFKFDKLYAAYASRTNSNIPLKFYGIKNSENAIYIGDQKKAITWTNEYVKKYGTNQIESKMDSLQNLIGLKIGGQYE